MSVPDVAWLTAAHEAGHALGDLARGNGVIEIWVEGDHGMSQPRGRTNVIACLTGPCAELRLKYPGYSLTTDDMRNNLHKPDMARAIELLGSNNLDVLIACWREAERLIDAHWPAVMRLAAALHAHGWLSGDEVEQIWRAASAPA